MWLFIVGLISIFAGLLGAAGMFIGLTVPRSTIGRIIATVTLTSVGLGVGIYSGFVGLGGRALDGFTWFGRDILAMPFTGAVVFAVSLLFCWQRIMTLADRVGRKKVPVVPD